jgi:hypothetical protein
MLAVGNRRLRRDTFYVLVYCDIYILFLAANIQQLLLGNSFANKRVSTATRDTTMRKGVFSAVCAEIT